MGNYDPLIDALPKSIRPVAEHLGMGIVRRIVEMVPGTRIKIPRVFFKDASQTKRRNEVFRSLSEEDQKSLIREFGGEELNVPLSLKTTKWRHAKIREMISGDADINAIALEVQLSRRAVLNAAKKMGLVRDHASKLEKRNHQIVEMIKDGGGPVRISKQLGVSRAIILDVARAAGLMPPRRKRDAVSSISDAHLTPRAGGVSHHPSRDTQKPAREPENAI